jgi:lipopolysaccharide/colanic/teichoic acid biosynthesis glycosyltransferase
MGRPKFAMYPFLKSEEQTSGKAIEHLSAKELRTSMFLPRYVSSWCLSRRKRCFDLILSLSALILFAPIMLLIGWLIKLTSKGPALFRQERVGLHQRTFVILKFRTMNHNTSLFNLGAKVTKQGDPRMTSLGAILRRLKLDELPQLINVARGEMSFVGPRPKIRQHENLCMLCRPGITGAATIVFSHEETLLADIPAESIEHYVTSVLNPEKCRLDSRYMETAQFWTDLRILQRTVFKLGNQRRSNREPQPTVSVHAKPTMRRLDQTSAVSVMRVENVEAATIEA